MGWDERQIIVVDDDQGKTASVAGSRKGFGEMIRAVGRANVGIVISLELSRLGRNSPDWANLIYLSRFTQTLISDGETIYDPTLSADRMVLGIRGQVCELELDTSIARMVDARWSQAQRGEARFIPPAGYEFNELGELVMTHDEAVADAIQTVFQKFDQLGNASLVYQYFRDAGRELPVRRIQLRGHPVVWMEARYPPVLRMLKHPIYAGAYVYGRTQIVKEVDGECGVKVQRQQRKDWPVLLKDHHPAYITYETYVRNQQRLEGNVTKRRTGGESGPVREGGALLQGRVRCQQCGRSMTVSYAGRGRQRGSYHYYICLGGPIGSGENSCQTISGKRLDEGVVEKFLEVTAPAGVEAAALAQQQLREEKERVERYWTLQQERATYEAQRAERQYMEVEPENRVVARELERRWNAKLIELSRVREQAQTAMAHQQPLTEQEVARAQRLGKDVVAVWRAPTTTNKDRKRLLRTLIEEVQVRTEEQRHYGRIVWMGGATTDIEVQRVRRGQTHVAGPELVDQLRKLAEEFNDAQISRILTRQGVRNKDGKPYTRSGVCALRRRHGIPSRPRPIARDESEGPFTAQQAARELGVANSTIHTWIREGVLRGGQAASGAPWRIVLTDEVRKRLAPGEAPDGWVGLSEAARRMGVPKSTVTHWVNSGKLRAIRTMVGRRSRWKVDISMVDNAVQTEIFEPTSNK
jgi:excisionase family DNA binding protein